MGIKLQWKKSIQIPDGTHQGKIVAVTERTEPYEYTDFFIELLGQDDIQIKYGCPSVLSEKSKLGKLMIKFGIPYKEDGEVEIEALMLNRMVSFMTLTKKAKDGNSYAEIVEDSIKPI